MPKTQPKSLPHMLKSCSRDQFPRGFDYNARYVAAADHVERNVHPIVVAGAARVDGTFLTGHGAEHINTVIARAADLINMIQDAKPISCLEVYLLMTAAQLHDIGNAHGREGHELGAEDFLRNSGLLLGDDAHEKRLIAEIAGAHGGEVAGDKDKISRLREDDHILGLEVRPRFLAALLRFADELADDRSRSSRFLTATGTIPRESEIYHEYALSLNTPRLRGDSLQLQFQFSVATATRTFGKGSSEVYLLDEIFERTLKMDRERRYCMRFLQPKIRVNRIDVAVDIFETMDAIKPRLTVNYRLEEAGYPDHPAPQIVPRCNALETVCDLNALNGASLADLLQEVDGE